MTEEQTEILTLWGIETLGMLAALPEKELIAGMGQAGKHFRQLSKGAVPHRFRPVEPVFTLEERLELHPLRLGSRLVNLPHAYLH